jgi:hypothetical protein
MMYGEKIFVVNNVRNFRNAAYDRIKKKEFPTYKVVWKARGDPILEARMVLPSGILHSYTYTFHLGDVMPVRLMEKKLEDYL